MVLKELKVKDIKVVKNTSRMNRYDGDVSELMASIKSQGLINPITVKQVNGHYEVVSGHRRYAAIKKLGYETINAVVNKTLKTDVEADLNNLAENVIREDTTLQEEGAGYLSLKNAGLAEGEIAKRMGVPITRVNRCLKLWTQLPELLRTKISPNAGSNLRREGKVSYTVAHEIISNRLLKSDIDVNDL